MKRQTLLAFALILLALPLAGGELRGTWTASDRKDGKIQMQISYGGSNRFGHGFEISTLSGLTPAQVHSGSQVPVTFEMQRDAGTLAFRGYFEDGEGVGHFNFTPNPRYWSSIESLGVRMSAKDRDDEQLLSHAVLDVSADYIRTMQKEGYDQSLDDYVSMRIFGVTPEVLAQYRGLGYEKIPYDRLIAMRVHGVTPEYIEKMRSIGFRELSLDDLVTSRIHRVTPEFVGEMKALGYSNLSFDRLVEFRIHRVTPEFVRELADLGYRDVSASQLVAMRIHRVTPDFIRSLRDVGYTNVPVEKLVDMKIHGIDDILIRKLK